MCKVFGYGFDVYMFSVGADAPKPIRSSDGRLTAIPIFDRLQNDRGFICDGVGVLYRITTDADVLGGEVFLRQAEARPACPFAYPWMEDDEIADLRPIDFDAAYTAAFSELLERVAATSPAGKMYVRIRCQGLEQSNLCGTWTPERFIDRMVRAGHLWGNMTYVLARNADEPQEDILNRIMK